MLLLFDVDDARLWDAFGHDCVVLRLLVRDKLVIICAKLHSFALLIFWHICHVELVLLISIIGAPDKIFCLLELSALHHVRA